LSVTVKKLELICYGKGLQFLSYQKWDFGMSILGENKMNEFKKNINFDDYDLCAKFNDYIVLKKR